MIKSIAYILIFGLIFAKIFEKLKVPIIIGMLVAGIVIGPVCLNLMDKSTMEIAGDLKKITLVIILIKAGLSLDLDDLKKVGKQAIFLGFLPSSLEIIAYIIFASMFFHLSKIEAALMGAVLASVSPAVVLPRMIYFIENKIGTNKKIPQMILASSSLDNIFVLILFSSFLPMVEGKEVGLISFLNIPISIVMGFVFGYVFGIFLNFLFNFSARKNEPIDATVKSIIVLALSFLLYSIEDMLKGKLAMSGLLAVIVMCATLRAKSDKDIVSDLSGKFAKMWKPAEILLFVLVGVSVDLRYLMSAGLSAILMIFIGLAFRSLGVKLSISTSNLNKDEKKFTVISYMPKATVQAAIGSVPLAMGLDCGNIILSVAVLSIVITATLGAIGIDKTYKKLLTIEESNG